MTQRLQKFLAQCGLGSRRSCEELILNGKISVNGVKVNLLGTTIDPNTDRVEYNGKRINKEPFSYWTVYKPVNVVCSCKKDRLYRRVIDLLPDVQERIYPAGRLDVDSEGLVILTNDGTLCNIITHPRFGITKEYLVWLDQTLDRDELDRLHQGIVIDTCYTAKPVIKQVEPLNCGCKVCLELTEGRNREIRKMFGALNKHVRRLLRIRIGPVTLDNLKPGDYRHLTQQEIQQLHQLENNY